jgi:hypothetical protein
MNQNNKRKISRAEEEEIERMYCEMLETDLNIPLDEIIPPPPVALSYGKHTYTTSKGVFEAETPICTYGNFSFIHAPPKTFKSYFVALLASTYLKSQNRWVGDKGKSHREGREVMHFDTEQGKWHCQRAFRRVSEMAEETEGYHTYSLRTIGYKDRMRFIDHKLKTNTNLGLVIIDGIADLVSDVNNIEEANSCIQRLMEWSANYNLHIITVIHSNWGSEKPTGHLGSFCEKKTETQISLERDEDSNVTTAKCKRSRNMGFEDIQFFINRYGFPEVIDATLPDTPF